MNSLDSCKKWKKEKMFFFWILRTVTDFLHKSVFCRRKFHGLLPELQEIPDTCQKPLCFAELILLPVNAKCKELFFLYAKNCSGWSCKKKGMEKKGNWVGRYLVQRPPPRRVVNFDQFWKKLKQPRVARSSPLAEAKRTDISNNLRKKTLLSLRIPPRPRRAKS